MTDQYDKLAPRDLVITLRSMKRRFEEAIGPVRSDPERFERRDEEIDGTSLTGIVSAVASRLAQLEQAVTAMLNRSEPMIQASAFDPSETINRNRIEGLDAGQASVGASADSIGSMLDGLSSEQWGHEGHTTNGRRVSLLEVAQQAARVAAEGLRAVEAHVRRL